MPARPRACQAAPPHVRRRASRRFARRCHWSCARARRQRPRRDGSPRRPSASHHRVTPSNGGCPPARQRKVAGRHTSDHASVPACGDAPGKAGQRQRLPGQPGRPGRMPAGRREGIGTWGSRNERRNARDMAAGRTWASRHRTVPASGARRPVGSGEATRVDTRRQGGRRALNRRGGQDRRYGRRQGGHVTAGPAEIAAMRSGGVAWGSQGARRFIGKARRSRRRIVAGPSPGGAGVAGVLKAHRCMQSMVPPWRRRHGGDSNSMRPGQAQLQGCGQGTLQRQRQEQ